MALLEIQNVSRRFGDFTAVDQVSIAIEAGEFFTLLGPSGCGKTTLLRMIAGFDLPDGGRILLNGEDLADRPPEERPVRRGSGRPLRERREELRGDTGQHSDPWYRLG